MKHFITVFLICAGSVLAQDCSKSPNSMDPAMCCKMSDMLPGDIVKDCVAQFGEQVKREAELPGPKRGCCIGDCITMKMGLNPTGDGNLDREGLKKAIQENMGGDWKDIVEKAVDECFAYTDTKQEEFKVAFALKPAFDGEKICHPVSGVVLPCIKSKTFAYCPSGMWTSSGECDAIKKFAMDCNTLPK